MKTTEETILEQQEINRNLLSKQESKKTMIYKRINDLNTFASTLDNETYLSGTDEYGNDITVIFDTIDLLHWIDTKYMKRQSKKYINNL